MNTGRREDIAANLDLDRLHAIEEGAHQLHAAERDLDTRRQEARDEVRRLEGVIARRHEDMRHARVEVRPGDPPAVVDILAGLEADLTQIRAAYARLSTEYAAVSERWQGRQRLAQECRAYARNHVGPVALGEAPALIHEGEDS